MRGSPPIFGKIKQSIDGKSVFYENSVEPCVGAVDDADGWNGNLIG